jgi:hypothetical protein
MKTAKLTLTAIAAIIIAACGTAKKKSTTASTPAPVTVIPSTDSYLFTKSHDGIYDPGNEELAAIRAQDKDITLEKLKEGYAIYTQGACTNCHGAKNIYEFGEAQWKDIVDDMASRASISDMQKDAVYKYVLAIKATQIK